ncbi:MAG: sugar phosphate isomerase/epimerase [Herpetosiphonaceae bacterium]|nr:sugar phosphate isomerase/epimerase [Herpetosiphonaceae bacterium]
MKLGLLTAAFPMLTLEEIAVWASANGYQALEIAAWPAGSATERRYAGVSHLDAATLTQDQADAIVALLAEHNLTISALAYYPNNLHPDLAHRAEVNGHLRQVIQAAALLHVDVVGTFVGRDPRKNVADNLALFGEVWPELVRFAGKHGVKIAIENCPMIFSDDEWPGGLNLAYAPTIWREMFSIIPDTNFGLNLDPSHLLWQHIDYLRVVEDFSARIFHVHAKDMEINREGLYQHGVLSLGMGWQVPRLPGLGEIQWDRFISALYAAGYNNVISVEHEDRAFEGTEEQIKRGFLIARNALIPSIV